MTLENVSKLVYNISLEVIYSMRKVELRMNEQEKYNVIKELVEHNGNKNRASMKLGISRRQIDRLIIKYKEKGKSAFDMVTATENQ